MRGRCERGVFVCVYACARLVGAAGLQETVLRLSDLFPRGTISRSGGIRIAQGAIYNAGGALELVNCQLTDNTASIGVCYSLGRLMLLFT